MTFVALVLTVVTFALVAYPFFKSRSRLAASAEDGTQRELYSKRDTTYSMLKELEFDFQSGILTEDDYRELETRYKRKAISTLKDIDSLAQGVEADDEIEKEVLELRRSKARPRPRVAAESRKETAIEAEVEKEVLKLRQQKGRFCPQCGAGHEEGDRFCSRCGTGLRKGEEVD